MTNKTADGRPTIRKSQSQSSLPGSRKTKRAGSAQEMPPWRGPDTRPADIVRKAKGTDNPIVGCRCVVMYCTVSMNMYSWLKFQLEPIKKSVC